MCPGNFRAHGTGGIYDVPCFDVPTIVLIFYSTQLEGVYLIWHHQYLA